ncbi:hypothetical protein [Eubacterium sp. AB3007]|uniref:hypothetical protein n=1 Tax=Eubacterium sp. AB3007 TaxID=1392487 RepID=UPI000A81806E
MSEYNAKNYTEQGGEVTHIGGVLEFEEGAKVSGFPGAENQPASTAGQVAALKNDFNDLLVKLKNAGVMKPDSWNLAVRLAPSLTDQVAAANNGKAAVSIADDVIIVTVDVDSLEESESSAPGQGTHKWIGLGIGTGLSSVALAKFKGSSLSEEDAAEAASVGLDQPGEFVLYIRAEEVAEQPYIFTLNADGYAEKEITIKVEAPAE